MELLYSANSTLASKSKLAFAASSLRAFCRPTVSQKKRPIIKLRLSTSFPCPCPVLLLLRTWVLCADSFLSPPECCDNLFFWGRSSLNSLKHWVEIIFCWRILIITGISNKHGVFLILFEKIFQTKCLIRTSSFIICNLQQILFFIE